VPKKKTTKTTGRTRTATFVRGKTHLDMTTFSVMPRTANVVHRVKLNEAAPAIDGSPDVFFKAHDSYSAPSQYAVASTRLARFLDMRNIISHNAFARVQGLDGIVSGGVPGVPIYKAKKDHELVPPKNLSKAKLTDWMNDHQVDERDGKYYERSGDIFEWVDYRDPRIQKGLSDLQLFDAISGQKDRHGGNIFIDKATGQVTGIDDDLSFGRGMAPDEQVDPTGTKYAGLPDLVDRRTAEKILALEPDDLRKQLEAAGDDNETLTEAEVDDAVTRLVNVKSYLRLLDDTDQLVTNWNDATYEKARKATDASYLGREARELEKAMTKAATDPDFVILNAPAPPAQPVQPLQPVQPARISLTIPAQGMPGLPPPPPLRRPRGIVAPAMVVPATATNAAMARQWVRVVPTTQVVPTTHVAPDPGTDGADTT
jgi:hypothetical protein